MGKIRDAWRKFRTWDEKGLLIEKVEGHMAYTRTGYAFNRWLFRGAFLVFVLLILTVAFVEGWGWHELVAQYYVECPADAISECPNPFYGVCEKDNDFCREVNDLPKLERGTYYGTKPSPYIGYVYLGFALALFGAFTFNHLRYNKGKEIFDLGGEE